MNWYFAYGLNVRSVLPLPELTTADPLRQASGEVVIELGRVEPGPAKLDAAGFGFWTRADEACHIVEKVGSFLVRGGREIVVDAVPGVEDRLLRLSVLGPALGLLLHQRGLLVLHASVVARSGSAIAFIGQNGWGKSTLAAALHAKGYDLVADDLAAIAVDPDGASVLPGFPQVKLWPEAATLLGEDAEQLPLLHPAFDKRAWRAERGFSQEPRRLAHIYTLAAGSTPAVEPLQPRGACFELLSHWYGHRFGNGLLQGASAARHLHQCVAVAGRVPMSCLRRSGGSPALLHLADLVDRDLQGRASRESTAR
jgi:hypothetical protein